MNVPVASKLTYNGATPEARLSMGVVRVIAVPDPSLQAGGGGPEGVDGLEGFDAVVREGESPPPPQLAITTRPANAAATNVHSQTKLNRF